MLSLSPAKWTRIIVPIAAALLLLAAACGDDDDGGNGDNGNGDNGTPAATETTAPADDIEPQPAVPQDISDDVTEAAGGAVETNIGDNFFTENNLKVPLNETTTISVVNGGSAIHNMRIAGPDGEFNTDDDTVSDPELISGGDTATVEFTPTLPGTYTFQCDFHPTEQGGVIVVE